MTDALVAVVQVTATQVLGKASCRRADGAPGRRRRCCDVSSRGGRGPHLARIRGETAAWGADWQAHSEGELR